MAVDGTATILVVEDEPRLLELLAQLLGLEGHTVHTAADADEALRHVTECDPELILLDLGLPGRDGVDLLPELRRATRAGIIVVSGRDSETDRVVALRLAADDYVVKPYSAAELLARCESVLRRVRAGVDVDVATEVAATVDRIVDGDLTIDLGSREVWVGGEPVELRAKEFQLLAFLMAAPNRVFSRAQLIEAVWSGSEGWVGEATVTEHIRRVRSKVEPDAGDDGRIRTVRGVGYRYAPADQTSSAGQR